MRVFGHHVHAPTRGRTGLYPPLYGPIFVFVIIRVPLRAYPDRYRSESILPPGQTPIRARMYSCPGRCITRPRPGMTHTHVGADLYGDRLIPLDGPGESSIHARYTTCSGRFKPIYTSRNISIRGRVKPEWNGKIFLSVRWITPDRIRMDRYVSGEGSIDTAGSASIPGL